MVGALRKDRHHAEKWFKGKGKGKRWHNNPKKRKKKTSRKIKKICRILQSYTFPPKSACRRSSSIPLAFPSAIVTLDSKQPHSRTELWNLQALLLVHVQKKKTVDKY